MLSFDWVALRVFSCLHVAISVGDGYWYTLCIEYCKCIVLGDSHGRHLMGGFKEVVTRKVEGVTVRWEVQGGAWISFALKRLERGCVKSDVMLRLLMYVCMFIFHFAIAQHVTKLKVG